MKHGKLLALALGLSVVFACGKHEDFLYVLPAKEPTNSLAVKVKEIHSSGGIDILWVIDNSGSMDPHQQNVIRNTGLFMQDFLKNRVSWKMGLISTDVSEQPYIGFDKPFDLTDPDPAASFGQAVARLGTNGDATERTFEPVLKAFRDYPGFLRRNTALAVLIVTDAPEQSSIDAATFLPQFRALVGDSRPVFVYSVLAATDIAPPGGCYTQESEFPYAGSPYEAFAQNAKIGRAFSICDPNFGTNMGKIGTELVQQVYRPEIRLARRPRASTIKVLFHDAPLPAGPKDQGGLWYYDQDRNSVVFYDLGFAQGETESVTVDFEPDDGLPDTAPGPVSEG
ncbi:MAG: VWA domain-containing protein [Bdellovibrionales bacterium]|nr:VWA domain-containing protein [Bdellovibrionales bacterium]